MSIMKSYHFIVLCLMALALSSCITTGAGSLFAPFGQRSFNSQLARGYDMLAEYEKYLKDNTETASYFEEKAAKARRGRTVIPGTVDDKALSAAETDHLTAARHMLMQGLDNQGRVENKSALAEAQVNFDCWLMRVVTDQRTAGYCQEAFYETIKTIDVERRDARTFAVHFDSGKAIPSADGLEVIKQAAYAHALNEGWPVYLVGYTDSVGDPDSNRILSMRRSMAVRNALAQFGVDMDVVEIEAVGEIDTTGSDAESRRVDIKIEPASGHKRQTTVEPEEILPHSF